MRDRPLARRAALALPLAAIARSGASGGTAPDDAALDGILGGGGAVLARARVARPDGTLLVVGVANEPANGGVVPRLRVALLAGADLRPVARGEAEALTDEPFWRAAVALDLAPPSPARGWAVIGVRVGNAYSSTARSGETAALHLFLRRGEALVPVFAAFLRRQAYDRAGEEACLARRGHDARAGGSPPSRAALRACDREHEEDAAWTVSTRPRPGAPADLLVRDARGRVVSTHRWAGAGYAPPVFPGHGARGG